MTGSDLVEAHDGSLCGRPKRQGGGRCTQKAGWGTDHLGVGPCKLHGGNTPVRHGRYSATRREELRELIEQHQADPDPLNLLPELALARALLQDYIDRHDAVTEALLAWHQSYSPAMRPADPRTIQAIEDVVDELEAHIGPVPDEPEPTMEPEAQPHGGWLRRDRMETEDLRVHGAVRACRRLIEDLKTAPDLKPRQLPDLATAVDLADKVSRMVKRIEDVRAQNAISRPELMRIMQEMGRVVARYVADEDTREKIQDAWLQIRA